ncbi:hypothetical protein NDU88_006158 [Pleurodeles waltl]|uniref:Uncharacterized protein n=1 Tax=Pleurodeles waltl TaxID=8319 RepID=A0AAV7RNR6_PLEWA|nr:hypothetical protein NDU88_006158 [Pleurodeles waltl]
MTEEGEISSGSGEASLKKMVQEKVRASVKEVFESVFRKKRKAIDVSVDKYWSLDEAEGSEDRKSGKGRMKKINIELDDKFLLWERDGLSVTEKNGVHSGTKVGVLGGKKVIQGSSDDIYAHDHGDNKFEEFILDDYDNDGWDMDDDKNTKERIAKEIVKDPRGWACSIMT